jgi:hypothetical protein
MDIPIFFPDVFDVRELVGLIVVVDILSYHAVGVPSLL